MNDEESDFNYESEESVDIDVDVEDYTFSKNNEIKIDNFKHLDEIETIRENLKSQLILHHKYINDFELFEIDAQTLQSFDMKLLFKSQPKFLQTNSLIPKTFFTELFLNSENESFLYLLSFIRDKVYQMYIEFVKPLENNIEYAKDLVKNNVKLFSGHDSSKEEVWRCYFNNISNFAKMYVFFAKELPGFNKICTEDFSKILNDCLPVIYGIRSTKLFHDGESYLLADHVQLTKKWIVELVGEANTDIIFSFHTKLNSLNLTNQELALLIPFVLTSPGKFFTYFINFFFQII